MQVRSLAISEQVDLKVVAMDDDDGDYVGGDGGKVFTFFISSMV